MAEKFEEGEFWLPAEFLDEDFFLKESCAPAGRGSQQPPYNGDIMIESESEEEDYIAGLTRQMAHSFLGEEKVSSLSNSKVMATSPQSTLSDAGIWSASSRGSPNGPSQVSSPPSSPLDEQRKDDAWDLLYAAAGEVGRMKQSELRVNGRGLLIPPKKPSTNSNHPAVSSATYRNYNPVITPQQLQAAQFYQLKHHQMIKQQVSATWSRQNRAARNNRPLGLSSPVWPLQRQQPGSGMRAVFLNSSGTRRESAGTGVFLPRRAGSQNEPRKKPACSSVLLPARVVQALNLNLQDTEINPRYPGYFSFGYDIACNRGNTTVSLQKPHHRRPPPLFVAGHEVQLPPEWTY